MNFLNKRNSAVACLVLFQLLGCYSSPVRSPRTSVLKLRNILEKIQRVPRSDQDYHLIPNDGNGADVAVTPGQSFIPTTAESISLAEPEAIDNSGPNYPDPSVLPVGVDETEHPVLPTDVDSGLRNSDSVETVTPSNVQEPIQKLEDHSYSKILPEQELLSTSNLYHSPTAGAPSNPAELPPTYPIVRGPEGPSAITVADLPLETILPSTAEKVEISSSPEASDQSSIITEQGNNVGALPLDAKTQTASSSSFGIGSQQIQVDPSKYQPNNSYDLMTTDNPNEKDNNSSGRPIGSRLRELGFPPISNTQDNFGVQVNWAEFR